MLIEHLVPRKSSRGGAVHVTPFGPGWWLVADRRASGIRRVTERRTSASSGQSFALPLPLHLAATAVATRSGLPGTSAPEAAHLRAPGIAGLILSDSSERKLIRARYIGPSQSGIGDIVGRTQ